MMSPAASAYYRRWNRNPRPQPWKFSNPVCLCYNLFVEYCICLNWLSGALVGVGGSDFIGYTSTGHLAQRSKQSSVQWNMCRLPWSCASVRTAVSRVESKTVQHMKVLAFNAVSCTCNTCRYVNGTASSQHWHTICDMCDHVYGFMWRSWLPSSILSCVVAYTHPHTCLCKYTILYIVHDRYVYVCIVHVCIICVHIICIYIYIYI